MVHFYTPWKYRKNSSFQTFLGGMEMEYWLEIGQVYKLPKIGQSVLKIDITFSVDADNGNM